MAIHSYYRHHLFCTALLVFLSAASAATNTTTFPAILVFGDSTVDTGNNNYITSFFQANHTPYGRDYPGAAATGRFSNGRLVPDLVAAGLGIKPAVPPFLSPALSDDDVRTGVCFASTGAGFDDITSVLEGVIPLSHQPHLFADYLQRLKVVAGEEEASTIVAGALIMVSAGTNDFIYNYYDIPIRKAQYSIGGYQDVIIQKQQDLIKEIYAQGGRRFFITGLAPIGCVPLQRDLNFLGRDCRREENSDAQAYNAKLQTALAGLEATLAGSDIQYVDSYTPFMDMFTNPQKYGFTDTAKGCCGTGYVELGALCNAFSLVCPDASKYMFWDSVHPTEAVYKVIADIYIKKFL